jgi:phage gp16-like protein
MLQMRRHALYAKIEIARKELGLDDADFRAVMETRFGARSRKDLSDAQLVELVEHFKACGFKPRKASEKRGRPLAAGREQAKMRALWLSLWHLGEITDASEEALAGFARRVTGGAGGGIEALQWVKGDDAYAVIEALKARLERAGVASVGNPRHRVIEAQRRLLSRLGHRAEAAPLHDLSDLAADILIASQGALIRSAMTKEGA